MESVSSSKNCGRNYHACQWERDIFLAIAVVFFLLNVVQITYTNRDKLFRVLRRGAERIPNDEEDQIINVHD